MSVPVVRRRSRPAAVVFKLFNPVPFGFFVAALIFDIIYARSGEILWMKSAAWLIAIGLLFAIIPRLVNLGQVWFGRGLRPRGLVIDFWLNLLAIVAATFNAFVHSRDAYAVIPEGLWLSVITVVLLCVASIVRTSYEFDLEERVHA
jgi:uncharacterized membrane protein